MYLFDNKQQNKYNQHNKTKKIIKILTLFKIGHISIINRIIGGNNNIKIEAVKVLSLLVKNITNKLDNILASLQSKYEKVLSSIRTHCLN
jgi:hypothetical protein